MEESLRKAFKRLVYEPQGDLSLSILHNVIIREKRIAKIKLYIFSFVGFLSVVGFVPAIKALLTQFTQSGFYEYLSLAFSSGSNLSLYWKELMMSLVESLPVINIILLLGIVFIFLLSVCYILKQIIKGQLTFSMQI